MSNPNEGKKVKGKEPVTIVFIADGKNYKVGQEMTVHSVQAAKFVESGVAEIKGEQKPAKAKSKAADEKK